MSRPIALVTGGGSGIGLAVAEHLINFYGYRVAILDINGERGQAESSRMNSGSDSCLFLQADAAEYHQQAKAFQQAFEWGGNRLDFFHANAGIGDSDSVYKETNGLDETTGLPKPLDLRIVDVNLNAVLQGVHLARHFLEKNSTPGGRILITSSCLGLYPNHCLPLYTATKHALVGFVRATAPVYTGMNITINALAPNLIETNLMPADIRPLWDRGQLTPMNTAIKALDAIMTNKQLTGQTIELALDELVFSKAPPYSTANTKWMCEQHELWEQVSQPLLPKPAGQNVAKISNGA
ncbi:hypothetical protein LTR62_000085 [Meristemomyces frigidus]|uniref:15-hydroxyprostaglandin dehydrogenase n=1 Tax=Meristemomyces frigidus TaxID=1508187 RepID=A0AAN7TJ27_9PEZI|nr:hypothetical protein LTR62_000085 [Meristemomyces frigidus]